MQDTQPERRKTKMWSTAARMEEKFQKDEQAQKDWLAEDNLKDFKDLENKISEDLIHLKGFKLSRDREDMSEKEYLTIYSYTLQLGNVPYMDKVLIIAEDGSFTMYKDGHQIPKSALRFIIHNHSSHFRSVSQVINAVAFLKNFQFKDNDAKTAPLKQ